MQVALEASKLRNNAVKLTFENLEYEVTVNFNKKDAKRNGISSKKHKIVKGVSGYALPG